MPQKQPTLFVALLTTLKHRSLKSNWRWSRSTSKSEPMKNALRQFYGMIRKADLLNAKFDEVFTTVV